MSYLMHSESKIIRPTITLDRVATNQLEVLRRTFEIDTNLLLSQMLESAIAIEFDQRLAAIGVLPSLDAQPEAEEAA